MSGNILNRDGLSEEWLKIWSEVENWYGDIKRKETGHQFLLRMQSEYPLASPNPQRAGEAVEFIRCELCGSDWNIANNLPCPGCGANIVKRHPAKTDRAGEISPVYRWVRAHDRKPEKSGTYHTNLGLCEWGNSGIEGDPELYWLNRYGGHVKEWLEEITPTPTPEVKKDNFFCAKIEQQALAFAKWTAEGLWTVHGENWYPYQDDDNPITADQLYIKFLEHQNKQQ